ncbi:MAG: helix-turn-helix domain-containing protein [Micromonosporaceae bacterium]|nr:helix-turn-helix domain-containing protein [Micromonosporaceae bacterium]
MSAAYGATIAKRRLSRQLRELREQTGFTANQVCDRLSWGRGKVGRFEANSWKRPELSDIRDLLRVYRVSDGERRELEDLAMQARERAWWREFGDVFGDTEFPGYEADAAQICLYMPLILPGLLQTQAYTEAQMGVGAHPPAWRKRALQARQRRQEILDRTDGTAPDLVAVITEASLLYRWGTGEDRRAQVTHLVGASRRPSVELRLLRFEDGPHPGMCGPINVFDFPGSEPQAVYLETDFAIQEVSSQDDVNAYIQTFGRIRGAALDAPATTAYLKKLAETLE